MYFDFKICVFKYNKFFIEHKIYLMCFHKLAWRWSVLYICFSNSGGETWTWFCGEICGRRRLVCKWQTWHIFKVLQQDATQAPCSWWKVSLDFFFLWSYKATVSLSPGQPIIDRLCNILFSYIFRHPLKPLRSALLSSGYRAFQICWSFGHSTTSSLFVYPDYYQGSWFLK